MLMRIVNRYHRILILAAIVISLAWISHLMGQLQNSGTAPITIAGTITANQGLVNATPWNMNISSGSIANTAFGVSAGVANVGFFRMLPSSCTQSTTFLSGTVAVATGAGTSITSTTTCVTKAYANNITNNTVTFRLQDKTGTPIIWVGGNADYSLLPNSNISFPLEGVWFTGGATAIAGTASAINFEFNGVQ